MTDVLHTLADRLPEVAASLVPPPGARLEPGRVLTDPHWLAVHVATARRSWPCPDDRVAGTLWWYSASSVLLAPAVAALIATGRALPVEPAELDVWSRADGGGLGGVRPRRTAGPTTVARFAAQVQAALGAVITPLADSSGATEQSLWAVAGDSLANRALDAGRALGDVPEARRLAGEIAAAIPPMPAPRFVDHGAGGDEAGGGSWTYLRRASCCLIYAVPGADKCASCPRQQPEVRDRRLGARAAIQLAEARLSELGGL